MTDILEDLFKDVKYKETELHKELYPFRVRIAAIRFRPPRHKYFEYLLNIGRNNIDKIFKNENLFIDNSGVLTFVFPERWMAVNETREFMYKIVNHKDCNKIKRVDIVTSSAVMLTDFINDQVMVIEFTDDPEFIPEE